MTSPVTVKVSFNDEEVKLQLLPGEFQFLEFDCWLRNRFDIAPTDKVAFKNKEGIGKKLVSIQMMHLLVLLPTTTTALFRRMLPNKALLHNQQLSDR